MKIIREPQVAGMFYPSSKIELEKLIKNYLDEINLETVYKNVGGIIVPHAGYVYSGKTAAAAYKTIIGKQFENVIVISPSHREYFPGITIFNGDAYKTPLGEISVNKKLREKIISKSEMIFDGDEGHKAEHALEVQLPFLQIVLSDFELIPIVIGDQRKQFVDELSEVLANSIDDKTLLIASSDLSHFYSKYEADILDSRIVEHINKYDYDELQKDLDNKKCEACGGAGIVTLMKTLQSKGYKKSHVVAHSDSSDISGDETEVVGYLSAVIYN